MTRKAFACTDEQAVMPVSFGWLNDALGRRDEQLQKFATQISDAVNELFDSLERLERRVGEIKSLRYRDIFEGTATYREQDCVTFGGSMWIAKRETVGEIPGKSDAWRLAVKRGRNAPRKGESDGS